MTLSEWLLSFLKVTAWRMDKPRMFGPVHICLSLLAILVPYVLGKRFPCDRAQAVKRVFLCGIVLAMMEILKQLFLYVIVNDMHYNFWYFPFQLCSIGMYIALVIPFVSKRIQQILFNFLYDISLPGALLALVFPEDMLRSYVLLTFHGFFWHAILVYLGLLVYHNRLLDLSWNGFRNTAVLYLLLAGIAILLNIGLTPLVTYGSRPSMFYLSPYEKTGQFFFHTVAERFGITVEHIFYISTYLLFCALFHRYAMKHQPVQFCQV